MIVVTRPSPQGDELTNRLHQANIPAIYRPLFEIQAGSGLTTLQSEFDRLTAGDLIITLSPQVSHQISTHLPYLRYPKSVRYFAIGKKSAHLFKQLLNDDNLHVQCPPQEDSEGLLKQLQFEPLANKNVLILRGNAGREILTDGLKRAGAQVTLIECYVRKPIIYSKPHFFTETSKHIIIITSLEHLLHLEPYLSKQNKQTFTLIVTSNRIAAKARNLGWQKIKLAESANNKILFKTIATLCHNG